MNNFIKVLKISLSNDYYLRLETMSFLMIVNKETNEYINLYRKDIPGCTVKQLGEISNVMESHFKYEI